jgi:hypothetical protein
MINTEKSGSGLGLATGNLDVRTFDLGAPYLSLSLPLSPSPPSPPLSRPLSPPHSLPPSLSLLPPSLPLSIPIFNGDYRLCIT